MEETAAPQNNNHGFPPRDCAQNDRIVLGVSAAIQRKRKIEFHEVVLEI